MQTQQKLGLATFLCLQVLMILIAIIRVSGFIYHNAFDEGWVYLWQQIEACVSVSTISLTAFRIMFVASNNNRRERERERSPVWLWTDSFRKRFYRKGSGLTTDEGEGELDGVGIPGGTLTGMRTAIGGRRTVGGTTMFSIFDAEPEGEKEKEDLFDRALPGRTRTEEEMLRRPPDCRIKSMPG